MKHSILLFFLAVSSIAYSQHSITGVVLDEETEAPVIGATLYIPKLDKGTVTDLDGNFSLDNIPEGNFTLVISSLGYASNTSRIEVPSATALELFISPTAIEMEEVIISTPFHQLQSENVMKVERATIEELNRTGSVNLAEGITQIAGVETITTGAGIGKPVIRGLSSNRVLVYTQGVRLENQQFGDEHGLGVSSSGVESVEVIKGPASLLYGSDALGGVLYLNPERYAVPDSTEFDAKAVYFTNTLGTEANAGYKKSWDKLKFLARGNYATHSDYKTGDGERVQNSRFTEYDLKTGVGFRNNFYKGDLRYNLNSTKVGIPDGIGNSTSKEMAEPYQEVQNHILSFDNSFYFSNSSLDVKLGYLFNDRKEFEDHHHHEEGEEEPGHEEGEEEHLHEVEAHGEDPALRMKLETLNYDVKYHFPKMGDFETIIGLQGLFQENRNLGEEFLIPDALTIDAGIFATTHFHLERWDFQAGIRYDNRKLESDAIFSENGANIPSLDRNFSSYNGAFGVKYDISPELTTRINLATGYRAPNLAELTSNGTHHGSNRYEVGNPDLENEQNYQLDVALEWRTSHFEVFGNAFYNNVKDYIYLQPTGEIREENPVYNYVQNSAELYGGESGIHIHPHPLDWLHIESSFEMVIGTLSNGEDLPLIPAKSVLNTVRIEFGEDAWLSNSYSFLSLKSVFEQNKVSSFEDPSSSYSLLSAGLGGTFRFMQTEIEARLSGNNLLNKTYISHLSRLKVDGIPNMGRNVSFSLKVMM